ncbi:MAG: hypothetical protein II863_15875 [Kiritimatiellae bacterium]|nr:hypothetical protein [Kiritimatiellia bacterium]
MSTKSISLAACIVIAVLSVLVAIVVGGGNRRTSPHSQGQPAVEEAAETAQALDGQSNEAPAVPPDVRDEVKRVVDSQESYAERNAALIKIWYKLNESEVGALEKCIIDEACCARTELHALKNDIMNVLRRRSGDPDGVVIFLCDGADVFLERGDNVMVDYCIQHAAAALEGNISSEARGQVMEMLRNATGYPDRTWSATALLSLDRAPNATWRDNAFVERQTMMLLKESNLDAVRVSCIDVAKRNRWRSVAPVLQELQNKRGLSIAMKSAIANALDVLR